MLHINSNLNPASRSREPSVGGRSASLPRQNGAVTIAEEDEEEEEIEEVEVFSPIGPNDIEETIEEAVTEKSGKDHKAPANSVH